MHGVAPGVVVIVIGIVGMMPVPAMYSSQCKLNAPAWRMAYMVYVVWK